ncbi:hypothetical protein ABZ819_05360 [Streptomyces venezuelae]|uniref:hypothetical protein n=1 Tax=Streptomyces venezuelae TaxID=54571 RepID=UPI00341479B8
MARLQILELPEGASDERPPFVLVVDESIPQRVVLGGGNPVRDYWQDIAQQIGARGVIVTPETVDIPANDTTAYLGGQPNPSWVEVHIEGDLEQVRERIHEEVLYAQGKVTRAVDAQRLADERTDIARDMDRLAKWRDELTDALGMDRTRDWDDIRNAAARLRKERDTQAAELERLHAGEEPVTDEHVIPTPAQWIWKWNRATPEKRLDMAAQIFDAMPRANNCFMGDHEAQIARLREELARLRGEAPDA